MAKEKNEKISIIKETAMKIQIQVFTLLARNSNYELRKPACKLCLNCGFVAQTLQDLANLNAIFHY